jgi:hypothetical protein
VLVDELKSSDTRSLPLGDLTSLAHVLRYHWKELVSSQSGPDGHIVAGTLDCPVCGETRPMRIALRYSRAQTARVFPEAIEDWIGQLVPSLFDFSCVQCNTLLAAVVYRGPEGPALAVLPSCRSGLTTTHTSEGVAFYLDQALRARSIDANSAAIAMFRAALELILSEEGYRTGTLSLKVHQLGENIEARSAPRWALDLEPEFLDVIRLLGNASAHLDGSEVRRQAGLDKQMIGPVEETLRMLLFMVYEVPYQRNARLAALRTKAGTLNI